MTILNMVGGGKAGPKVPLNEITTLSATAGDGEATLTWTDIGNLTVNGVLLNERSATKLIRKVGSAPSDSSDGTLVTTETVADTYSVNPYTDSGLTNGTTYYYKAFSVGSNGLESGSNGVDIIPQQQWQPGANTVAYYQFDNNLNDSSGNGRNLSIYVGNFSYGTLTSGKKYCQLNASTEAEFNNMPFNRTAFTISAWCLWAQGEMTSIRQRIIIDLVSGSNYFPRFWVGGEGSSSGKIGGVVSFDDYITAGQADTWYNLITVCDNDVISYYLNGQLIHSEAYSSGETSGHLYVNGTSNYNSSYRSDGKLSELILENKVRTAQEVSDYFDATKGDYGIS